MAWAGVNPDLQKERDNATFNVESLSGHLYGGPQAVSRRREIINRALQESVFTEGPPVCFLSREQLYDRCIKKAMHVQKLLKEWDLDPLERQYVQMVAFPFEASPDGLHSGMFQPTIENQASEEQKKKWMPKISTRQYLGTYAQTELGHGTHLRKLETTATFDPRTDEFILNTPTVTAMKWWPGGLGKTTNCGVVMAQLFTQGVNRGIFPFFVIFRDEETHEPLPGVTVGDIGPKIGYNSIDNGFLRFDNFRIPRGNMLGKNAEVHRDGTLVLKSKQKKPAYGTMTMVRTFIVRGTAIGLAAGMTIAIRYSAVRRQSELKPGAPEPQIMDYQTQQYKLYPYLAMSYAFHAAFQQLFRLFLESAGLTQDGNASMVAELHALSSGLKAYCSYKQMEGLELGRLSCGGHGFSEASGFPKIYTTTTPNATYEGENTVLLLQTARYLVKCVEQARRREKLAASVAYLARSDNQRSTINEQLSLSSLADAFEHRAHRIITETADAINREVARGAPEYEAKNRCGVYQTRASMAHSEAYVVRNFAESLSHADNPAVVKVLTQLCQLLATFLISNSSGDFLEDGYMTPAQVEIVRRKEIDLLADLRPNAVALVDAFDYPDIFLGSVLGRYDGQVYENLYKWAQSSPLNKTQVHESYYKYMQPMMKAKI